MKLDEFECRIDHIGWSRRDNNISCDVSGNIEIPCANHKIFASGLAKCSPEDEFNYGFGKELARARAMQKLYKKYEKELIKYSYRNSKKRVGFFFTPEEYKLLQNIYKPINEFFKGHTEFENFLSKYRGNK